jgi:hypothetical protein
VDPAPPSNGDHRLELSEYAAATNMVSVANTSDRNLFLDGCYWRTSRHKTLPMERETTVKVLDAPLVAHFEQSHPAHLEV